MLVTMVFVLSLGGKPIENLVPAEQCFFFQKYLAQVEAAGARFKALDKWTGEEYRVAAVLCETAKETPAS